MRMKVFESFLELSGPVTGRNVWRAFIKFFIVAGGGTLLGILFGFFGAFLTKFTENVRIIEPTFVFVVCYLCYLTAECFELSAILGISKKIWHKLLYAVFSRTRTSVQVSGNFFQIFIWYIRLFYSKDVDILEKY